MDQTAEALGLSPNSAPGWQKCLSCQDLGVNCNGPSILSLGDIASARAYHKALRKHRGIQLKRIADVAKTISEATVNEYFSNADKDYKWTTVFAICGALVSLCGDRVGLPPLTNACPASSSEVRAQLAAAELKVAAAELRAAQSESTVVDLQASMIETEGRSAERIDQIQKDYTVQIKWMQKQMFLWQCLTFGMVALLVVVLLLHAH